MVSKKQVLLLLLLHTSDMTTQNKSIFGIILVSPFVIARPFEQQGSVNPETYTFQVLIHQKVGLNPV